jgi:hypothetical protein
MHQQQPDAHPLVVENQELRSRVRVLEHALKMERKRVELAEASACPRSLDNRPRPDSG